MIENFMTALQVILVQLTFPRDQQAKSDLFQSTWKLCCRDSHKTQVWLCFFTLSLLTLCNCDISPTESMDLQKCLGGLRATIEKSDAMLYTPSNYDVTDRCKQKMLQCYMLELMVILEEEETAHIKKQCIFHFNATLKPETSCPECEIYPSKIVQYSSTDL